MRAVIPLKKRAGGAVEVAVSLALTHWHSTVHAEVDGNADTEVLDRLEFQP